MLQEYVQLKQDIAQILTTYGTQFKIVRPTKNLQTGIVEDRVIASLVYGTLDAQMVGYYPTSAGGIVSTDKKTLYLVPPIVKIDLEVGDRVIEIGVKNTWRIVSIELFRPDGVTLICYQLGIT